MTDPRTILITGATDGLGRALAQHLAADGAALILHGRDQPRLDQLADELSAARGQTPRPRTVLADFSELAQVRRLADDVRASTDRLEVLVLNAGIGSGEPDGRSRRESADGYELRLAVNHLAGFLLTLELLALLRASAPARIVFVASLGQHRLDFADLMLEHDYDGARAYGQSKLAQIMCGLELADHLAGDEVTVNSLHPSTYMPTKMVLEEIGYHVDNLEDGVAATRRLISEPSLARTTGRFYNRTREARAHPQAYDHAARTELWRRSVDLVGHDNQHLRKAAPTKSNSPRKQGAAPRTQHERPSARCPAE